MGGYLRRVGSVTSADVARTTRSYVRRVPWRYLSVSELLVRFQPTAQSRFLATSSSSNDNEQETKSSPAKYEHVRKLMVGLGNPGEKYAHTRHNIGAMAVSHFLRTYAHDVVQKPLAFHHEARVHGDLARFHLRFQQDVDAEPPMTYRYDDLISRSSKRRKEKTVNEGVPHEHVNVALLLPSTYMNRSGSAVRAFMSQHHWRLKKNSLALNRQDELLVITDDVALPFGTCRFKHKGGPGGQNGVKDIIKCVGTDRFARLRIGVGAPEWFASGNSGAPAGTAMDRYVLGRFYPHEQDQLPDLLTYTNELLRLYLHRGVANASTMANGMDLATYRTQFQTKNK